MEKKVNQSSTKTEIFDAYTELLSQLETKTQSQPKESKEKADQEKTLKIATGINKEGIINQIAVLKITLNAELEKIEDALVTESKKLSQVVEAIKIQEQRLEELYGINATADSVSVMLSLQKEKKEAFEKEMEQKRQSLDNEIATTNLKWQKEKKEYELALKDDELRVQKQRKREEEEYTYNLGVTRKKDTDLYDQKKATLEKELILKKTIFEQEISTREQTIIATENELKELREKAIAFPKQLELAVKEAITQNTEKLQNTYSFESQLNSKEYETGIKLRDQEIVSLKAKIKDLDVQLTQLSAKAEQADKSAKDIAMKAIESSSNFKVIERSNLPASS